MRRKNIAAIVSVMLAISGVPVPEETVFAQDTEKIIVTQEEQSEEQENWSEEENILTGDLDETDYGSQVWLMDDSYGVDNSFLDDEFLIDPEEDGDLAGTEDVYNNKNAENPSGTSQNADGQESPQNEDETTAQTGTCGENTAYSLDSEGNLRITGTGSVTEISAFEKNDQIRTVVVEEGITDIAAYAFSRCDSLISVTLPDSMTVIPEAMFINCDNLSSVTLPEKLETIGSRAFSGCLNLESLTLPDTLTGIGSEAFAGVGITDFALPDGLQSIGEGAFTNCIFTEIQLPETITDLGARAFQYCEKLQKITIPESISEIRNGTFLACSALKNVTLPQNLQRIGEDAFSNCKVLAEVDIPAGVTEIGEFAFYKCNKLNVIYIRRNDVIIGAYAIGHGTVYVKDEKEWKDAKNENLILYGNIGSTAEKYAAENGLTFPHPAEVLIHYPSKEASCEENGNMEYWHCDSCGLNYSDADGKQIITDDVSVPKKGHDLQYQDGKAATSEAEGSKEYYLCTRCKKMFWDEAGTTEITDSRALVLPKTEQDETEKEELMAETEQKQTASDTASGQNKAVQTENVKTRKITGLKKNLSVAKGKTIQLNPTLVPQNSTEKMTYRSSDKKVAVVSAKGVITGKKAGTAKITVKSGSKKCVVTVKVTKARTAKLSGIPAKKSIKKGKTFKLKAVITPKNSDDKITYTSSNKKVVTVTPKGIVKGVKKGTATITVKSGSKKKTCKVVVK